MKRKKEQARSKNMTVRLSPDEYEKLQEKFKTTTHRVFTEYLRDMLLQEPITIYARSKSLDEFLPVAIGLKNELNAIGKNFNQAVKRLQTLQDEEDLRGSLEYYQATQFSVQQKIEDIKSTLIKIHQSWLPK
jgi:mobilization protein NikA